MRGHSPGVLLISGDPAPETRERAAATEGVIGFLRKPFDRDALDAALSRVALA